MAKVTLSDFYYKGKRYDSKTFDLDIHNRTDVEISLAIAKKLNEYEELAKKES